MDLRIKKTYRALIDAFTKLLEEQPYENITVAMLCDEAMIRRTTFYKHFADKAEFFSFFVDGMRIDLVEQAERRLEGDADAESERMATFQLLIDFLLEHEKLMDNVLSSSMAGMLTFKICEKVSEYIRERYADVFVVDGEGLLEIGPASEFIAGGVMRLIRLWWADGHRREDEQKFVQASNVLVSRVLGVA